MGLDWGNDFERWQALKYRTGHYYFDTNRDWFAHTQVETRHRIPTLQSWRPQVMVDAHEMGPDTEFFFDPPTEPTNPFFPKLARDWLPRFGEAYSRTFDKHGFEYTTRDLFNYFYPGYTSSYGSFQGAVSMLFEQGSSRGLSLELSDESVRTLGDGLEHQYLAAWTTVRTSAENREELLGDYHESIRVAIENGHRDTRRYLLGPGGDPGLLVEAARLLRRNGIEIHRLTDEVELTDLITGKGRTIAKKRFPTGTWVVEAAQPLNRLVRSLLEPQSPISPDFLAQARERVERGEDARFYDMTAWSLPLLFNLEAHGSTDSRSVPSELVSAEILQKASKAGRTAKASYAYLFDGRMAASVVAAVHLRNKGYRVMVTVKPTSIEGESVAGGTVVVRSNSNPLDEDPERLRKTVEDLASRYELAVRAVSTGRSDQDDLPALGDGENLRVKKPRIAILAEHPVHAYSFGWAWYTLDRQYEIPTTVLRVGSVAKARLDSFNVLVIPDLFSAEDLGKTLGSDGKDRLTRWIRDGGTLVAIGAAVDFVRLELKLTKLRSIYADSRKPSSDKEEDGGKNEKVKLQRFEVPGAFFRASLEPSSWLAAGYPSLDLPLFVFSNRAYKPPVEGPNKKRRIVARIATKSQLIAGHAWPESVARLSGAVAVYEELVDLGRVIAFAEDPNFRGYLRGMNRLFLNAVVLGPSAP